MSASNWLAALLLGMLVAAPAAWAAVTAVPGEALPFEGTASFQETIEARCTICHTRERVDAAIRAQQDLEPLLQHMLERGAILSERDRAVLGTFWGSPLKGEAAPTEPPR
jgi:cytochrome c553